MNIRKGFKRILKTKSKKELIERVLDLTADNANLSVKYEELYE